MSDWETVKGSSFQGGAEGRGGKERGRARELKLQQSAVLCSLLCTVFVYGWDMRDYFFSRSETRSMAE